MEPSPGVLDIITTVVTNVWGWFGGVVGVATSNPVMWVPVGFGIAGASVAYSWHSSSTPDTATKSCATH